MKIHLTKSIKDLLFVLLLVLSSTLSLHSQVVKAFSQRSSNYTPSKLIYSVQGDYSMIGNTNLTVDPYGNFTNNSNNNMVYVDVDGDPNTFNSSSATLELSTENGAIPECSNIIYAGLYWTGRASSFSSPEEFTVTKGGNTKTLNKRKVQFKGPGATGYTEFVANPGNIYYPNGSYGNMYSSYVEITDYVNTYGIGEYTLADLALIEGDGGTTGFYGGWGMIVVYENSEMKWRDITIFDGHAYVQGNATVNYELPVSGFQTAQSGPINMKLGMMAGEGDVGISGDYFQIRNWQDNSWITLNHTGNSTSNFFNSSIQTGGNPRNPSLQNNTGLDISSFNIPNPGNSVVTNGQTSTRFRYGSTQDTYVIFCVAMAVDAYVPDVEALVSTEFVNGIPVGSGPISALPGDLIDYKLELKNKGTEAIDNMVITIPVPYTTTFVPSSILTQINFSPIPTPNNAYYDPNIGPTGSIVWDFGTLPLLAGFPDSVLAEISFQLEVTQDCNILKNPDCPPRVVLAGGNTTGQGATSGSLFNLPFIQGFEDAGVCSGQPITSPLIVDIDADQFVDDNCQSTPLMREFVFCDYDQGTLSVDSITPHFPAGLSFYNENNITTSSIKYDEDNPFPATIGTKTYFAIPDNVNFCYYTFTITVQDSIATSAIQTSQVSCPGFLDGSIDLTVLGGTLPISYAWTGPNGYTSANADISSLEGGNYNVLITDGLGCTAIDSALVSTIPDNTNPNISCTTNKVVDSDPGNCDYNHAGTAWDATASDNCAVATLEYTLTGATTGTGTTLDGTTFELGITTVVWDVEDASGNTNSCTFTVTVQDNENPVISTCGPGANQNEFTDSGSCTYSNSGTGWDAIASDNCGTTTLSYNLTGATSGSGATLDGVEFNVGTTTVTWTATDGVSNSVNCAFDVTVTDNQNPIISDCGVTGSQTVNANAGVCTYTNTGTGWDVVASDNCTTITVDYALSGATTGTGTSLNGVTFNTGTTLVTWTVTDAEGNTSTCSFDIVVNDNQIPVILSCPTDITITNDTGVCGASATWTAPTATDNCGVSTFTSTHNSGDVFTVGTTTVTYTATDAAGNNSTCSFDVTVTDNEDPAIAACPTDITLTNDTGVCGASATWTAPTATDNCGVSTFTSTHNSGDVFTVGTTTVTYTATDAAGNNSTCSFDVTVTDNEDPAIAACPTDITITNDTGVCGASATWTAPTATDNCGVSTFTSSHSSGDVFTVGTTTVTYTATDAAGNSSTCSFDVTVTDNENPTILCQPTVSVNADLNGCEADAARVNLGTPVTGDNCGVDIITSDAPASYPVGTTVVTWTVTDIHGNTATCAQNVIVTDAQAPIISDCGVTGSQTVNADAGLCSFTNSGTAWDAVATDNCTTVTSVYVLSGVTSGTGNSLNGVTFNNGTTKVTWTVTDAGGNSSICSYDIIVLDTQDPVIATCPTDITITNDLNVCGAVVNWTAPTASDNCGVSTFTSSHVNGAVFPIGTTTVTYTATDASNNTATCSFDVVIADTQDPVISGCPSDITINNEASLCSKTVTWTAPTVSDNCTGITLISTHNSGDVFTVGTTTVTYTATDAAGNTATCSFDVTVTDNEDPAIAACPSDITITNDTGVCGASATWTVPTATDNCGVSTFTNSHNSGDAFPIGTTTVTYTATDAAGNSSTCSFDVTVTDNEDPAIADCPTDITLTNDTGVCGASATWTAPTATDNCGVSTFTSTHNSGDVFTVGTTTVTYTATDAAGNSATCSFDVTVTDNEDPTIAACPTDINLTNDTGVCGASATWTAPTATDNCGVSTFTSSHSSGDFFTVGTTTVTYTATDAAGNSSTCSFDVTVTDNENPTILCQPTVSVNADLNGCEADAAGVNLGTPVTSDNCAVATLVNDAPASYPVGTTVVTWTVTDIHGNTVTCAQNVIVTDAQAPIISDCGVTGSQIVNPDAGVCSYTHIGTAWDAAATDNCTTVTSVYELTGATTGTGTSLNGVAFNAGTTTVTWTVTDASGNTATCSYDITVIDNQVPVIVGCPTDITVATDLSECGAEVTWNIPAFTDNCGTVNVTSSHNSGDFFPVGTTTVTYTGIDASENVTQCKFDVIVNDTELPLITCNGDIESCDSIVTFSTPNTSDNCEVASVTMISGLPSGSVFPIGTTTVTYEVEDIHGNTEQCSFDVIINASPEAQIVPTDVSCNGQGDGSIDITVTNGTAPYSYAWSNLSINEDVNGLIPGTYNVTVTDDKGCTTTASASITEPDVIQVSGVIKSVLCFEGADGEIDLTVIGGTTPYTYVWSNGSTTQDLTGLSAAEYNVTITDGNGCTTLWSGEVEEPNEITASYTSNSAICDAANGNVITNVDGGTSPYNYSWNNGATTANLDGVIAGSYELTITDANGCTFILETVVTSTSNLDASISSTDILCYGQKTGSATIIVNTGNGPYSYNWSNGGSTPVLQDLGADSYSVIVTDNFGCQVTLITQITEPDKIVIDLFSPDLGGGYNVKPYNGDNGSISSDVFGGTSPYTYSWSTGDTTQNISGLGAGSYSLIVTDENGCIASERINISQPMTLEMPQGVSPNGDGNNDYFVIRGIDAYESNEIKIFNRWGNIVYQKNNYDNTWNGQSNNGDQLPDGTYFVIFTVESVEGQIQLKGYIDLRRKK